MTTTEHTADNGVNVPALLEARTALSESPQAADFVFRASNEWIHGVHSKSTIEAFDGLGTTMSHKNVHAYEADHPECFAATDNAPTPVEFVLVGLASCLTAGVAAVAEMRGIQLRSVKATIEGDLNILGVLGADPEIRNGFTNIRVNYQIDADCPPADLEALVAQSQKRSAVFDIVTNPTLVDVTVG